MAKKTTISRGVKVSPGKASQMRERAGSSNVGKYKNVKQSAMAGTAGGASKGSYPINTKKRAKAALSYSRHAPNPEGIKSAVYKKYPGLKKRNDEREGKSKRKDT